MVEIVGSKTPISIYIFLIVLTFSQALRILINLFIFIKDSSTFIKSYG